MFEFSLLQLTPPYLIGIILFALLILSYLAGFRWRMRHMAKSKLKTFEELGAVNGAFLGLLALLLAFTFGMSNSRYDARRLIVTEETNAIGTAILRTEIYPDSMQQVLRQHMRQYLETRIEFYEVGMDIPKLLDAHHRTNKLGMKVWTLAAEYARKDYITTRTSELIPALNAMLDIATTRKAIGVSTIPDAIIYFLIVLCLTTAFLLGYDFRKRLDWVVIVSFSLMLSATVYIIIDLDRPRTGFIHLDTPNRKIVELRELFDQ